MCQPADPTCPPISAPLVSQDPLRSAQLLAEHDGYPAAIARLLQLGPDGRPLPLPVPALRLLRRLVAAAGGPFDCAYTLELLMQPTGGRINYEPAARAAAMATQTAQGCKRSCCF